MNTKTSYDVKEVSAAEWPESCSIFSDYSYEQSRSYAIEKANESGARARFMVVLDEDEVVGAASVRTKKVPLTGLAVSYVSGGPMVAFRERPWSRERFISVLFALRRTLVDEGNTAFFFRLPISSPTYQECHLDLVENGFQHTSRFRAYRTILIDISVDEDLLMKRLAGKWRTDLKYAKKSQIEIEVGRGENFHSRFMNLFGEMRDTKNFDVQVDPRTFFGLPENETGLKTLVATKNGQDIAGHVVSNLGDTSVYLFGATNELGRKTKAGYLLNWQAMLLAQQDGCQWYDLGGIDPDGNPGVYRFKKKMGGEDLSAVGPYEALPNNFRGLGINALLHLRDVLSR